MKVVVGIATFDNRNIQPTLDSLQGQADAIHIYDNAQEPVDLTDNGKFVGLTLYKDPIYYFTCDDDLIYPPNYVCDIKSHIDRTGCIVSYHGRRLLGLDRSYYYGHATYRYNTRESYTGKISVPGTGVMGFRTDYFNPVGIHLSEDKRKSDLVFALAAAKAGKEIRMIPHDGNWIKPQRVTNSIHSTERLNEKRHIEIANEIFNILAK